MFGKKHASNSEMADQIHQGQMKETTSNQVAERATQPEAEKWTPLDGYALFQINLDNSDEWDIARCTSCMKTFEWKDWDSHDGFYTALELHEINHALKSIGENQ